MSKAATYLWHKPDEDAPWTKRFVIVSDSIIHIYNSREDYQSQKNAIHLVHLSENTKLIDGNDTIVHQGWLIKKGKLKWNARWCALLNYGYLKYVDIKQTSDIRQIDFSKAKFSVQKYHNLIYWMYHGDRVYFRCDSPSIQKTWYQKMTSIQQNCSKIRSAYKKKKSLHKEPTLFAFTVINKTETHYLCAMNDTYLAAWKKCIIEQISRSESSNALGKLLQKENIDSDVENDEQNIHIIRGAQVTYIRDSKGKISVHELDENKSNSGSGSGSNSSSSISDTNSNSNNITPEMIEALEDSISRGETDGNKDDLVDIVIIDTNDELNIENIIADTQKLILMDEVNESQQSVGIVAVDNGNDVLEHKIDELDNDKQQSDTIEQQKDIQEVVDDSAEKSMDVKLENDNVKSDENIIEKNVIQNAEVVENKTNDLEVNVIQKIDAEIVENIDNGTAVENIENETEKEVIEAETVEELEEFKINYNEYGTFILDECDGNDFEKCESLKRMILILRIYKEHNEKQNQMFLEYLENIKCDLINDYHHILHLHLNENKMSLKESNIQFEKMYKKIMQQNENDLICDISKCNIYTRNIREREKEIIKYENCENLAVYIDLLDSIHCYFIHSVSVGLRMIVKPPADNRKHNIGYDTEFAALKSYLTSIRKNIETIGRTNRFKNKFITQNLLNQNKEESKEENIEQKSDNVSYKIECKDGEYHFGKHFDHYWDKRKKPKYSSLKTEIISNEICSIESVIFDQIYKKANLFLNNSIVLKKMKSCKESKYKIKKKLRLNLENIICVILYTDYDGLSYHFRETFYSQTKDMNYEFFNWSKMLCETVNCYGICMENSKVSMLYHCIDTLQFEGFVAGFNAPTSMTTRLQNACICSEFDGIILEFKMEKKNKFLRYFNCSFISCMGNENEILFINTPSIQINHLLELVSIRNISTNENYMQFIEALSVFNKLINKEHLANIDDPLRVIINNFISFSVSENNEMSYPKYILTAFQQWTNSKNEIVINLKLLKHFGIDLMCESDKVSNLLDFYQINVVFKQITYIISERVGPINTPLLKCLLQIVDKINKLNDSKLDKMYLYDVPNIHEYSTTKDYAKYQSLFVEKNWNIETKSGYHSDYLVLSK